MESGPAPSVPLASPSAFPALPLHPHPHPHPHPHSPEHSEHSEHSEQPADGAASAATTAASLSYARASKTNLPPTTAPEGISLPPKPHPHPHPQPHPHPHPHSQSNGNGKGPGKAARKPRQFSNSTNAPPATATAKRPRTVPGMPASMLPPPVANKKAKHKPPPVPAPAQQQSEVIPTVGKKRRQTLRKTLPPTASKLSALAASFDFVPRDPSAPRLPETETSPRGVVNGSAVVTEDEAAAIHKTVASAGAQGDEFRSKSYTAADARGAVQPETGTDPAAQSASARKPVSAGSAPEPSLAPSSSLSSSSTAVAEANSNATLEVVEPSREQQQGRSSLAGFLDKAFVAANGEFAPLDLPPPPTSTSTSTSTEVEPSSAAPVQVTTIPGAVDESPMADLSWREKKGWWSPNPDADGRSASTTPPRPRSPPIPTRSHPSSDLDPSLAGPAAVEPAQSRAAEPEILLRFPPWTPASSNNNNNKEADERPAKETVDGSEDAVKPLAEFLPSAFVQPEEEGQRREQEQEQQQQQAPVSTATTAAAAAAAAAADAGSSALSSFLSGSFSATGPPTPLEAPVSVTLGKDDDDDEEVPVNAEAIVADPDAPLSDILDVDAIENGKAVVVNDDNHPQQQQQQEDGKKEKKHGWWSPGYVPPSTTPATTAAEAPKKGGGLVDEKLVQETVGSAGAQGDEFRARSYSTADRTGAAQLEPTPAGSQSAKTTTSTPPAAAKAEEREQDDAGPERSSTPIGHFLEQAFSTRTTAHPTNPTEDETEMGDSHAASSDSSSSATTTPRASSSSATAAAATAAPSLASAPAPSRRRSSSRDQDDDDDDEEEQEEEEPQHHSADEAPSLTLAIASAWHTAPWSRKLWAVLASVAINVGLPFINGVMLGFGELFARNVLGVRLGWPVASSPSSSNQQGARANTGSVGLRAAGPNAPNAPNANIGREVPGHAGAKTAAEAVVEGARELSE
ncbi:hypothetical protein JCM3774_002388 [Rhodotorula dairenensis]